MNSNDVIYRFQIALQTDNGVVVSSHTAFADISILEALTLNYIDVNAYYQRDYKIGVWSKRLKPEQLNQVLLKPNDRIELYMPLKADPKHARQARVKRTLVEEAAKENAHNRAKRLIKKAFLT